MTLSIPDNFNGESPRTKYMSVSNQATTPERLRNQPDQVVIPLLEERVVVNRRRRKVGEVVVRKEIETYIVKVPIRREKLIVERVSPDYEQIAVVELGQAQVTEFDNLEAVEVSDSPTVSGEFSSAKAAIYFLEAIASEPDSDIEKVQVRVVLKDAARQTIYQRWLDDWSQKSMKTNLNSEIPKNGQTLPTFWNLPVEQVFDRIRSIIRGGLTDR